MEVEETNIKTRMKLFQRVTTKHKSHYLKKFEKKSMSKVFHKMAVTRQIDMIFY